MEGVQKLLVVVIITLTILLTVVGIQVILVIVDVRKSLKRLNNILEDAILGGGLIKPEKLTGILELFGKRRKMETRGEGEVGKNIPSS
ncbi:hypothetical protein A2159_03605 [Candidatus Woesebacteria bacterium RBG_13_34_9]|uniref:Uncharacterized protein n=1 Tax=Candidatus Woesebacteria bacterium RBG_13_34_9 TaxID=1802477 RepID=A0A1F7X2D8_9BACT|nr:MAG: hypothetical protein A2159_03605 [Candidatus Woesebacteria bacterium RBG_13_34_9]